jgi:hypothetical protein
MLSPYLRKLDTTSLSNRINLKADKATTLTINGDTYDLSANRTWTIPTTDTTSLSNRINLKLNISDTASMLNPYLRKADTASLSNRINLKLNISDTAAMLANYLPLNLRTTTTTVNLNNKYFTINGLNPAGAYTSGRMDVAQNFSGLGYQKVGTFYGLTVDTLGSGTFYSHTSKPINYVSDYSANFTANSLITKSYVDQLISSLDTTSLSNRINLKLNISDTAAMLSPYQIAINARVKYTDTASMLAPYLRKADTASLSNRINLKQDILSLTTTGNSGPATLTGATLNIPQYQGVLTNPVTGTGTINTVAKFTSSSAIGNSNIKDDGNAVSVSTTAGGFGALQVGSYNGNILMNTTNSTGGLIFQNTSSSNKLWDISSFNNDLNFNESNIALAPPRVILKAGGDVIVSNLVGSGTRMVVADASGILSSQAIIDTTSLSNRINLKLNISDTAAMLSPYLKAAVTSVGLSMPAAFTVTNSPVTSTGTIAVTGAGTAAQYVRGDGQLATLPSSASGGSSVAYYLNGSVNQGTIGGSVYYEMNRTPIIGAGTDFSLAGNGLISQFITDVADPNRLEIPAGNWNFEIYMSASSSGGTPEFYVELLKYDGTNFTSIASSSANPEAITNGTTIDLYVTALAIPQTTLLATDRLAIRVYIVNSTGGRTITMHTENSHLCEIITNFAGGVSALNGLTANTQYLAVGTSGNDFAINSLTDTHTFNLPTASSTKRGALSSADWSTFNGKMNYSDTASLSNRINLKLSSSDTVSLSNRINTKLNSTDTASLSNRINAKADALSGTTNTVPKFTSGTTIGNSNIKDDGSAVSVSTTAGSNGALQVGNYNGNILMNTTNSNAGLIFKNTSSSNKLWDISSFNNDLNFNESNISPTVMTLKAGGNVIISSLIGSGTRMVVADANGVLSSQTITGVDTTSLSNRINLKLNISDTASMLSGYQSAINSKQGTITLTTTGTSGAANFSSNTLNIPQYQAAGTYVTSVTGTSPIVSSGGTTPAISIPAATSSVNGYLSSTDWTTFNGKQNALTNPTTGTGTTNYLPKFTGASTIGNSILQETGGFLLTDKGVSTMFGVAIATTSSNGGNLTIKAGGGFGSGNTAGNLYLGYGRGNSSASNGAMYFGMAQPTDAVGLASTHMTLDASGNLGLGVTPSASSLPTIETDYGLFVGKAENNITSNAYFNTNWKYTGSGFATRYSGNSYVGQHAWFNAPSGTGGNAITFTQAMTLFNSGNLLLTSGAVTDAGYKLDVNGTGRFSGDVAISKTGSYSQLQLIDNTASGSTWIMLSGFPSLGDFTIREAGVANHLVIKKTTGAATFSSSVSVGTNITLANIGTAIPSIRATSSSGALDLWAGATGDYDGGAGITLVASDRSGTKTRGELYLSAGNAINNTANGFIDFATANASRMRITSGGNVIGKIDFSSGTSYNTPTAYKINEDNNWAFGSFNSGSQYWMQSQFNGDGSENRGFRVLNNATSTVVFKVSSSGTATISSLGTGVVYSLSGTLTGTNPSDSSLKNSIEPLSYGLTEIMQLKPKSFYYNSDTTKSSLKYGFIAQDVKSIMPDIVRPIGNGSDKLGLESDGIYVTMVNAIKELSAQIKELQTKIQTLENK